MVTRAQWKRRKQQLDNDSFVDGDEPIGTIPLEEGYYISRIWFFWKPGGDGKMDMLATLWRKLPDGRWRLSLRWRYYKDNKVHESDDEKSNWRATWPANESEETVLEKLVPTMQSMMAVMPEGYVMDVTDIKTDKPFDAVKIMSGKPYFHIKMDGPVN